MRLGGRAVEQHLRLALSGLAPALGPVEEDCVGERDDVVQALGKPLVANPVLGMVVVRALRAANALSLTGDKRKFLQLTKR